MSKKDTAWNPEKAAQIAKELRQADQILVGIGGGFTAAAGVAPLPLDTALQEAEYWPFWLPYIESQRLNKTVPVLYQQLAELLQDKDYFVIDSNVDGFLQHSGLELARIYKAQGDMARVQCSQNCQNKTWIGKQYFDQVRQDASYQPRCPHCGAPLVMNVYIGKSFVMHRIRKKTKHIFVSSMVLRITDWRF